MLYFKALGLWVLLGLIATVSGIVREKWLVPRFGKLRGHQLGTLVVCLLFVGVIGIFVYSQSMTMGQALNIGPLWLVLTVLFESVFGHWVLRRPWKLLLADYNIARGRVWVLVLLTEVLAPAFAVRALASQ